MNQILYLCLPIILWYIFVYPEGRFAGLGPDGVVIQNGCDTKIRVYKVNYQWIIHDYSFYKAKLPKGQFLKSPLFHAAGDDRCKWVLAIHPNGIKSSTEDHSSLFLFLDFTSKRKEVFAKFKLSFCDKDRKKCVMLCENTVKKFEAATVGWGFDSFIPNNFELPSNDKLLILTEVTFSFVEPINESLDNFDSSDDEVKKCYKNQECADVVISANGKEFKAHKSILMARSPVFAAMFNNENTKKNGQIKVEISDLDEQVVEEMLNYIYTNKSGNLEKLAAGLLAAAEKYGLDGLKELSQNVLIEKLSDENAIDTLILADLHNADHLKSNAINYIVAKSAVLMKSTAWKKLSSTHKCLTLEVWNGAADKLRNCIKKSIFFENEEELAENN